MSKLTSSKRYFVNFGVPLALFTALILLMKLPVLKGNNLLELAISLDLLLIIPLIYFLLIRKTSIPKTTVVPVSIIGLLVGLYFLPNENQTYLNLFKTWLLPIIEVSILIFVVYKVKIGIKNYKNTASNSTDFFSVLKTTCSELLPEKLVIPFATEVAVFYYGFINWKTIVPKKNEFTYHKNSGTTALFAVFILIIGVETFALHVLLLRWSELTAWVLTALSIYTGIQVFGFAKSLSKRPINVNQNSITLKYGIINEVTILYTNIINIEVSSQALEKEVLYKTLSPLGELESLNVIIYLKEESELIGLYGFKKKFKTLAFHVDEVNAFVDEIKRNI